MNVVMTGTGDFVEVQGTAEQGTFCAQELSAAAAASRESRAQEDRARAGEGDRRHVAVRARREPDALGRRDARTRTRSSELARAVRRRSASTLVPRPADVAMPEETGTTFLANARLKARAIAQATGRGRARRRQRARGRRAGRRARRPLGALRRRGRERRGEQREAARRAARASTARTGARAFAACSCSPRPTARRSPPRAASRASSLDAARATGGFGYDPLFQPEGDTRSLAEYADGEKNAVSHRGRAAQKLLESLTRLGRFVP